MASTAVATLLAKPWAAGWKKQPTSFMAPSHGVLSPKGASLGRTKFQARSAADKTDLSSGLGHPAPWPFVVTTTANANCGSRGTTGQTIRVVNKTDVEVDIDAWPKPGGAEAWAWCTHVQPGEAVDLLVHFAYYETTAYHPPGYGVVSRSGTHGVPAVWFLERDDKGDFHFVAPH